MNDMISIIIPVYNVEHYLDRCIESVFDQTYENIEIILVDDGSTDTSGKKCDIYKENNPEIIVIHKENGGLASARNAGLDICKGKYITFLDSDDYISKYYVENLYKAIKRDNANLSISMFVNVTEEARIDTGASADIDRSYRLIDSHDCIENILYQRGIETSAPGKLYKADQIGNLRFPDGKLYEDIMFTANMVLRAQRIAVIDNVDYFYYQRRGSIQYATFNKQKMDCIYHSQDLNKLVRATYPDLANAADVRYFSGLCNIIFQIPDNDYESEKQFIWSEIKRIRSNVFLDRKARKKNRLAALFSYTGLRCLRKIYRTTQTRGIVAGGR